MNRYAIGIAIGTMYLSVLLFILYREKNKDNNIIISIGVGIMIGTLIQLIARCE